VLLEDWLICNQLSGGAARALALKAWKEDKTKMVPWVGVAARLSPAAPAPAGGLAVQPDSTVTGLSLNSSQGGRAFCFLPLPAFTCLPVHINGYFELSSNRRDVWHGADMAGAGR
jgi:sacsin